MVEIINFDWTPINKVGEVKVFVMYNAAYGARFEIVPEIAPLVMANPGKVLEMFVLVTLLGIVWLKDMLVAGLGPPLVTVII